MSVDLKSYPTAFVVSCEFCDQPATRVVTGSAQVAFMRRGKADMRRVQLWSDVCQKHEPQAKRELAAQLRERIDA